MTALPTQQEIDARAEEVFQVMAPRVTPQDLTRLREAYAFASLAHQGQKRKTGEPYIIHPVAVARIAAAELELTTNTVIAAFLHDVVEDTAYTLDDVRSRFGDDVAFLVDVVTKKKKKQYDNSKQIDNYRQMLESVNYDIRALLVKLADRLHNMRTLDSMSPDKQMKIAGETDFFYAPLAGRLGLYHVRRDLENLSFRYRCPREYALLETQLAEDRQRTAEALQKFTDEIDQLLASHRVKARTEVRYRGPYSIWRTMTEDGVDVAHVDFKHYVRIIYESEGGKWREKDLSLYIYSLLTDRFKERPGSVVNYIDSPKDNGYQSFHVKLLNGQGAWEELHISSERMVRHSRLGCVVERDENGMSAWLERFRSVLQDMAQQGNGMDFMEGVSSSFYSEDIVAFTPKGKGIILPKGATALDFAYEIHTDMGEHAKYARINGQLTSVKTELHRGDCVEIGTAPDVWPIMDWLDHVTTYKAKRCLRSYLRGLKRPEYDRCPLCRPLPGDEIIGFRTAEGKTVVHTRRCPDAIRLASEQGDAIVSVSMEADSRVAYPVRIGLKAIDRYHLLRDITECITERQRLFIDHLNIQTEDFIANCTIDFAVHSATQLQQIIDSLSGIRGVDEVQQLS